MNHRDLVASATVAGFASSVLGTSLFDGVGGLAVGVGVAVGAAALLLVVARED